jgi:RNA polymerase sigma-70 factor (ECF subfamily)
VHLPDPVVSHQDGVDPEQEALLADAVGLALLVVLDTLAPAERVAFVLHDTFAVPFDEIAPIVGRSEAAARQLASRARRRVQQTAPVPDADLTRQRKVVDAFFAAARDGDLDALVPGDGAAAERALSIAERLGAQAVVGVSAHESSPAQLHRALREADLALALVRAGEATAEQAATGAWQLLVRVAVADPGSLRRLRDTSIGPALAHDADHRTDLVGTFRTYLAHGGNMNAAAAAIPSHRHTVAYRLERLRALTGLHPGSPEDRERLGLGVKAQLVLNALGGTAA